eukprot:764529-Hanusia_phi.AAC.11
MESFNGWRELGGGGQGKTMTATEVRTGMVRVIKRVPCPSIRAGNDALQEAKFLQALDHPHVVKYVDVFLHQEGQELEVCTVMEFCEGGDLARRLQDVKSCGESFTEEQCRDWISQIALGLEYLHLEKIIHRDIKLQNILIGQDKTLKIADFGLAGKIEHGLRTSRVGTPAYLAPEMLQREGTGEPVDIWGLGCVALELVTLSFLTDRKGMLGVEVLSTPLDAGRLPHRFSPSLRRCIVSMLCSDPGQRPTATEVLETCQTSTPLEPLSGAYKARQDRAIAKARTGAAPTAGRGEPRPDSSQDDSQSESKSSQDDWSASILGRTQKPRRTRRLAAEQGLGWTDELSILQRLSQGFTLLSAGGTRKIGYRAMENLLQDPAVKRTGETERARTARATSDELDRNQTQTSPTSASLVASAGSAGRLCGLRRIG